jgi:hypothetical protein
MSVIGGKADSKRKCCDSFLIQSDIRDAITKQKAPDDAGAFSFIRKEIRSVFRADRTFASAAELVVQAKFDDMKLVFKLHRVRSPWTIIGLDDVDLSSVNKEILNLCRPICS